MQKWYFSSSVKRGSDRVFNESNFGNMWKNDTNTDTDSQTDRTVNKLKMMKYWNIRAGKVKWARDVNAVGSVGMKWNDGKIKLTNKQKWIFRTGVQESALFVAKYRKNMAKQTRKCDWHKNGKREDRASLQESERISESKMRKDGGRWRKMEAEMRRQMRHIIWLQANRKQMAKAKWRQMANSRWKVFGAMSDWTNLKMKSKQNGRQKKHKACNEDKVWLG